MSPETPLLGRTPSPHASVQEPPESQPVAKGGQVADDQLSVWDWVQRHGAAVVWEWPDWPERARRHVLLAFASMALLVIGGVYVWGLYRWPIAVDAPDSGLTARRELDRQFKALQQALPRLTAQRDTGELENQGVDRRAEIVRMLEARGGQDVRVLASSGQELGDWQVSSWRIMGRAPYPQWGQFFSQLRREIPHLEWRGWRAEPAAGTGRMIKVELEVRLWEERNPDNQSPEKRRKARPGGHDK